LSLPNIPDMTPEIRLTRQEAVNLLLTSVAMEEMGISHILNAEGEKIQYVLSKQPTICELLSFNKSTERLLRDLIHKEMLLQEKLTQILELEAASNADYGKDADGCDDDFE